MANRKKGGGGKSKQPSSSGGGFGAPKPPPPTLEEVVSAWPTRLPADSSVECPCKVGLSYADCCKSYHSGEKLPDSPEECLKMRYSAFAYRLPLPIINSTHKSNGDWQADKIKWARRINKEQMFDSFRFEGLEIGEREAGKDDKESFLNMRVTLMPIDEATKLQTQPEPLVFTERSKFVRNPAAAGTWLYAAGEVKSEAQGFKDRTLKDDKDLAAMQSDVDYVQSLLTKDKSELIKDIKDELNPFKDKTKK